MLPILFSILLLDIYAGRAYACEIEEEWLGDFDEMLKRRCIRALVPFSKTLFFIDKGRKHGAVYELLMGFENDINEKHKKGNLKIDVAFVPVPRDELLPALLEGRGDVIAADLTITEKRLQYADFTTPFVTGINEILIASPSEPVITNLDELSGREIFVRKSSSYYRNLKRLSDQFLSKGKKGLIIRPIPEYLEDEDVLEMVNKDIIPLTVVDDYLSRIWSEIFSDYVIYNDLMLATNESIAWMVRKDSPQLKEVLSKFITNYKKGTLLGNILINRYYRSTKWIRNPIESNDFARFKEALASFKKYGEKYEIDWLLLAACAYQESGINQNRISPAGAIGVMQVLPKTAAGHPVYLPNIKDKDENIHAGAKYLRWIYDSYFKDEEMTPANRVRFTFASYNAGPTRILNLRKKAQERGLDPNVWFDQVELVVAESIGRETVQYVRNIYKYYFAYKSHTALENLITSQKGEQGR